MPRYALRLEYDGRPFAGWQRQDGPLSVQQTLEEALRALDPALPSIAAAGRTDAGVHATGQVAQADLSKEWTPFRLSEAVNWHLKPAPVAVTACAAVPDDWHARFSAIERRYTFRMIVRRAPLTLDAGQAWRVPGPLDPDAMAKAAKHLIGQHDFTTFRASICQAKSPVKTLDALDVEAHPYPGGQEIRLHLRARSFLHNQVRSIAGTLERVGAGAWPPDRVRDALVARDRAACGPVAPP
ncbi:MAG: tRNA pseudouridine(38-40) synthase TruA, partial [Pseudomonadota bacterium]